ncbi:outer membrane beta-barrel protein [Verrucomicrobiaceae bacterium 227]
MTLKTTIPTLIAAASLSAQAGEPAYVDPAPAQTTYMAPASGLDWSLGASAGFLVDAEEDFYSIQLGKRLKEVNGLSHILFFEVGYSDLDNDGDELDLEENFNIGGGDSFTGDADFEATFIPITLNYKLEKRLGEKFSVYGGLGAGVALIDVDGEFNDSINDIDESGNDSDATFFAQAFIGAAYHFTPNFEMFGGARYMFIDDYSLSTDGGTEFDVEDNDDVLIELGGRFHF